MVLITYSSPLLISWCPYCNLAKPVVQDAVDKFAPEESHFITVDIENPL